MRYLTIALILPIMAFAKQIPFNEAMTAEITSAIVSQNLPTTHKSSTKMSALAPPSGGDPGDEPGGGDAYGIANEDILARMSVKDSVTPYTTDLLGEHIDLNSGTIGFSHTDLVAKGIGPDIVIARKFYPEAAGLTAYNSAFFDDWLLEIPAIHTTLLFNGSRYSGSWGIGKECSGSLNPGGISDHGNVFESHEYWNGDSLILPGRQEKLVEKNGRKTKSNWKFDCFTRSGGNGEGFIGHSPDGLKYTFDKMRLISSKGIYRDYKVTSRYQAFMLASKVEDRFGNWIQYNYSGNKLTSITSSDGRTVFMTYGTGSHLNHITKVSYNGRHWTYSYGSTEGLDSVTRPDGKSWVFDLSPYRNAKPTVGTRNGDEMDDCAYTINYTPKNSTASITHPDGVTGTFQFEGKVQGRSNTLVTTTSNNGPYIQPQCYATMSIIEKVLDGPGMSKMTWNYDYSENTGFAANENIQSSMLLKGTLPSNINNKDYKWTQVIAPDNSRTKYYHNRDYSSYLDGSLAAVEEFDTNGAMLLQTKKTFTRQNIGNVGFELSSGVAHSNRALIASEVKEYYRVGGKDVFTHLTTSYDIYGNPTQAHQYNDANGNKHKYIQTTYNNDPTYWLIGRPYQKNVFNGTIYEEVAKTTYHSAAGIYKSQPANQYSFGRWHTNYTYLSNGLPNKITRNANNQWVKYSNYYRGIPRTIQTPKSRSTVSQYGYRIVNANAQVTRVTDFEGNCENYSYNTLGRLTLIDPCDEEWSNTNISYSQSSGGIGVPGTVSGMTVQTVSQGDYRKQTFYDGLLRPLAVKEWDNGDSSNTTRYVRTNFNYLNKPTFQSQQTSSASTYYGVNYSYDGLGRPKTVNNNAISGQISYRYLVNDKVEVNDNKGNVTTTTYLSYASPSQSMPILISSPAGVSTSMAYNIYGNVSSVSQGGEHEYRVYDDYQKLCKVVREDVGPRAYSFDSVGQLSWKAYGTSISTSTTSCDSLVSSSNKTNYFYGYRGNTISETYEDDRANKSFYYDRNGQLITLNTGSVASHYSYNSLGGLASESLSIDGNTFTLTYQTDNLGNKSSITYPSGQVMNVKHNALSQQLRVGNYATNAKYHALGAIKSHNYGNGFMYSATLNSAGLLASTYDARSGTYAIKQAMTYDSNNNLTFWDDQKNNAYDLKATYDGLDRLNLITDSYSGTGDVNYDTKGNITYYKIGSKSIGYAYDSLNRLNYTTGSKSYNFLYDSRGNVTSNGHDSFSYNVAGQMDEASGNTYVYDGHNRRVKTNDGSGLSYSMYSLSGQLMFRKVGGVNKDYYRLGGKLVATKNSSVEFIHTDYLGSPSAFSNLAGVIIKTLHYQPFGETIGTQSDDVGYTGHKFDTDIGLSYMQARYYDPVIGRFYSNDPVGFRDVHSFNRYAYANNNPYKYIDPDGRSSYNPQGMVQDVKGLRVSIPKSGIVDATTVKVGMGAGLQVKAQNVPGVGSFDAGGSVAVSSVMTTDKAAQGIEFSADAGLNASDSTGSMTVKVQLGKAEALVQPQNGTMTTKIEGAKATDSLNAGNTSVGNSGKVKVGGHIGLIKIEVEVDTSKLN
ncbi:MULTISPECIES: RHS repeat domain-containing protein [unclassified Colwellia]|uniref:RHS repeat domain-containing protein n=1 Tax=unclassified Colwellia TaxID=196834 RepID=UPI0015F37220|nr:MULTISPECIES: RHS repeat-associated core domain-containing protein [unclassified Colwellia]MBA6379207.1 RHS repeat-associated core domain-containing protein [Colwellia sp. BRX10-7]MBA6386047.1 RHS repeat-associated core domain-containing protein [Colwellia sp. BRX10-2]MBA6401980.1 RHS repeat-associated core domain-containing protein [Colwellia sp. BRX10-5]MBA6406864.1 RHS repeat-associated core domain-containing protein [Colwellia sp. BRX10-1]